MSGDNIVLRRGPVRIQPMRGSGQHSERCACCTPCACSERLRPLSEHSHSANLECARLPGATTAPGAIILSPSAIPPERKDSLLRRAPTSSERGQAGASRPLCPA